MKQTGKWVMTLVMAAFLTLGAAGCGGQQTESGTGEESASSAQSQASEKESESQESRKAEASDAEESTESSEEDSIEEISDARMVYGMWQLVFDEKLMTEEEKAAYEGEYDNMVVTMIVTADGKATVSTSEDGETLTGEANWELINNELVLTGEGGTSYFRFKGSKLMVRNSPDYMYYARIE